MANAHENEKLFECLNCGRTFTATEEHKLCPSCNSTDTRLMAKAEVADDRNKGFSWLRWLKRG